MLRTPDVGKRPVRRLRYRLQNGENEDRIGVLPLSRLRHAGSGADLSHSHHGNGASEVTVLKDAADILRATADLLPGRWTDEKRALAFEYARTLDHLYGDVRIAKEYIEGKDKRGRRYCTDSGKRVACRGGTEAAPQQGAAKQPAQKKPAAKREPTAKKEPKPKATAKPKAEKPTVDGMVKEVEAFKQNGGNDADLAVKLGKLTVPQLKELSVKLGVKVSGLKSGVVSGIVRDAMIKRNAAQKLQRDEQKKEPTISQRLLDPNDKSHYGMSESDIKAAYKNASNPEDKKLIARKIKERSDEQDRINEEEETKQNEKFQRDRDEADRKQQEEQKRKQQEEDKRPRGTHSVSTKKTSDWFGTHIEEQQHLSEEQKGLYKKTMSNVLSRMPDSAAYALRHGAVRDAEWATGLGTNGKDKMNDLWNKAVPEAYKAGSDRRIGGFYDYRSKEISLDGSRNNNDDGSVLSGEFGLYDTIGTSAGIYAHELTHALDNQFGMISGTKEWENAFQEEIAVSGSDGSPISDYATTKPIEGFAEFGRLVYGTDTDRSVIEKRFPKCVAVFKSKGLWK